MNFNDPFKIYSAESNIEAHLIVEMLAANGIEAFADEDQSGASLWGFGRITQFHLPNIWIDKSSAETAAELIRQFEEKKRERARQTAGETVSASCESCGETSDFAASLNGTVQSARTAARTWTSASWSGTKTSARRRRNGIDELSAEAYHCCSQPFMPIKAV